MPMPNGGLITETNAQYYAGAQGFTTTAPQQDFTFTFNTPLNLGSPDPAAADCQAYAARMECGSFLRGADQASA